MPQQLRLMDRSRNLCHDQNIMSISYGSCHSSASQRTGLAKPLGLCLSSSLLHQQISSLENPDNDVAY